MVLYVLLIPLRGFEVNKALNMIEYEIAWRNEDRLSNLESKVTDDLNIQLRVVGVKPHCLVLPKKFYVDRRCQDWARSEGDLVSAIQPPKEVLELLEKVDQELVQVVEISSNS